MPSECEVQSTPAPEVSPMERQPKKIRISAQEWIAGCNFEEVLSCDSSHKSLFALLKHENGESGVFLLNKSPFSEDPSAIEQLIKASTLNELSQNDIFGSYSVTVPSELNVLNTQLIYPANEKIIAKYRAEEKFVIEETPEDYKTITLPFIEKYQLNLDWVYNFLEGKSESERIIFEDPDPSTGFMLAPDIKWDGKTVENLYVLAIIKRHGVKSIRDLTASDIPMLEKLKKECIKTIEEKYGLRGDQLRIYFHYQPSFYHLHVHFVNLKYDAPAQVLLSAVLFDDVVNNLRLLPDYYQKATLSFTRKKSDKLLQTFRAAGRCKE